MPLLSVERREIPAQPFVFVRATGVPRAGIAAAIGEGLGKVFAHLQQTGLAPAGPPLARYSEMAGDVFTMEIGFAVAAPATGSGDVLSGALPGGPMLVGLHAGPYDELSQSFGAMERWTVERGARVVGPPWELYLTDPGAVPDQADWRTEIYFPLAQ
jgi:AraC family transcriptional regulator